MKVLAVATTHAIDKLIEAGADWVVQDLRSLVVRGTRFGGEKGGELGCEIEIKDAWR